MDEARVRRLLEELSGRIRDRAILWRGDELSGSDVDLVALSRRTESDRAARTAMVRRRFAWSSISHEYCRFFNQVVSGDNI